MPETKNLSKVLRGWVTCPNHVERKQRSKAWSPSLSDSRPVLFVGREKRKQRRSRWDRTGREGSSGSIWEAGQGQQDKDESNS